MGKINMATIVDCSEIPYLSEILEYLPIDAIDKEDISSYIRNITNMIGINYKYEQYQFAYFGIHLLYMTYIYCTVWKISKIRKDRYTDTVVFAKPYYNRNLDLNNIESVFQYSYMPEKELPKILSLIDLDKSQIDNIVGLVDIRNDMAHASGKLDILTEENFETKANAVHSSIRNIHICLDKQIRIWFEDILIKSSPY